MSCNEGCAHCSTHFNPILEGDNGALKRALYKSMGHRNRRQSGNRPRHRQCLFSARRPGDRLRAPVY